MTEGLEKELLGAILYHGEDPHIFEELWPISQKIQPEDFGDPLRMAIYSEMRERIIGSQPITAPDIQEALSGVPQEDLMREVSSLIIAYENGGKKKLEALLNEAAGINISADGIMRAGDFLHFSSLSSPGNEERKDFDKSLLPDPAGAYAEELAQNLQVPEGMVCPIILGVISMGIQQKYCINAIPGWYEPPNLYLVVSARPSERKSPVMRAILEPVYEYEREENQKILPELDLFKTKRTMLERKIESLMRQASNAKKAKVIDQTIDEGTIAEMQAELREMDEEAPSPVSLVVDDLTMEVLAKIMAQNHERIGIVSTEGGLFNTLAGRYDNKPVIDLVLKGYTGDRYKVDRMGRQGQDLAHPLITLILCVQPHVIAQAFANDDFTERGLFARMLINNPPSKIGSRTLRTEPINPFIEQEFRDLITRIYRIPVLGKGRIVNLDESAHALCESWFDELERIQGELREKSQDTFAAWMGKLHGTTVRIALCLHVMQYAEDAENHEVNRETMERAIRIAKYYMKEQERLLSENELNDPPEVKDAKYILTRLEDSGCMEIRLRDLHQMCRGRQGMERIPGMVRGLNELSRRGYIRVEKFFPNNENNSKGGRPYDMVYINPEYIRQRSV